MILSKYKTDKISTIKNLNLYGNEIDSVAVLKEMPNLEVVSLS